MRLILSVLVLLGLALPASAAEKVKIALNWVPEPEFGGIYEARRIGAFEKRGVDADIQPGGAGTPTWQMVASGQADFAVSSADEVLIARARGADVVAFFTIYQTCPQTIMVHRSRGFTSIDDVFRNPGTLAMEVQLPYGKWLQKKYGFDKIQRVPYTGGVANFLADKNFSQQCFVFSEPIAARHKGADPQTFLIADAGYNPYTGVIITRGQTLRDKPQLVKAVFQALQDGWRSYLDDPKPANDLMGQLNKTMDAQTFAKGAEAQKPLVETDHTRQHGLGTMTADRWQTLGDQLVELKVIKSAARPEECYVDATKMP